MTDPAAKPFRIAVLALPDHAATCLAGIIDPWFVANWLTGRTLFQWQLLSLDGAAVRASNGMMTAVEASIDTAQPSDVIFIAASFGTADHAQNKRLLNWLRRAARFGTEIGALETGSEVLAAAGLLDGHEAAVHWYNLEGFRERYPLVRASDARQTLAQGRMTCSGGTATFDLVLALITRQAGTALAAEVARQLMIEGPANPTTTSSTQTALRVIAAAEAVMRDTLEHPLPCRDLALRIGVSDRQLQRHFA
ncbi:MAG: GlxA family transcriptional regulator, partial [Paracoccaceae bacterium]